MTKEIKKFPSFLKFKKLHRGYFKPIRYKNYNKKETFEIKTISAGILKWKIIDQILKKLKKNLKKKSKIKIYIQIAWAYSKKSKGVRLGKGKGKVSPEDWVCRISAGIKIISIKTKFSIKKLKFLKKNN